MDCNVGKVDRAIRVIVAVIFAYLGYAYNPLLYIISLIAILTAALGFCPLYKVLKLDTCKK